MRQSHFSDFFVKLKRSAGRWRKSLRDSAREMKPKCFFFGWFFLKSFCFFVFLCGGLVWFVAFVCLFLCDHLGRGHLTFTNPTNPHMFQVSWLCMADSSLLASKAFLKGLVYVQVVFLRFCLIKISKGLWWSFIPLPSYLWWWLWVKNIIGYLFKGWKQTTLRPYSFPYLGYIQQLGFLTTGVTTAPRCGPSKCFPATIATWKKLFCPETWRALENEKAAAKLRCLVFFFCSEGFILGGGCFWRSLCFMTSTYWFSSVWMVFLGSCVFLFFRWRPFCS